MSFPEVHTKIRCIDFAHGEMLPDGWVRVRSQKASYKQTQRRVLTHKEHEDIQKMLGLTLNRGTEVLETVDLTHHNEEWGRATFYVTSARMTGGGSGYPDVLHVEAVRLDDVGRPTKDRVRFLVYEEMGGWDSNARVIPGRIERVSE